MQGKLSFALGDGVHAWGPADLAGISSAGAARVSLPASPGAACCGERAGLVLSCFPPPASPLRLVAMLVLCVAPCPVPVCVKPLWGKGFGVWQGKEALCHPGAPPAWHGQGYRGAEPPPSPALVLWARIACSLLAPLASCCLC